MRNLVTSLVVLALLTARGALAQEAPPAPPPTAPAPAPSKPDTPEQAADKVLAAIAAKDSVALKALAASDAPDPWLVADELCARSKFDEADVFAKAAPRVDVEKLPEYVAAQRAKPTDPALRTALARSNAALRKKDFAGALAVLDTAPRGAADVVGVRLEYGRGLALRGLNRLEQSAAALRTAGDSASARGWLAVAGTVLHESGAVSFQRSDNPAALAAWEARLSVEERRGSRAGVAAAVGNIGAAHMGVRAYAKALEFQERSLRMKEELGDRVAAARTLSNIGITHRLLGAYTKALECQERALKTLEELGDRAGTATTLGNIGLVHSRLGAHGRALEFQERALKLKEEVGDRAGAAATLEHIGNVHENLGAYTKALEFHERALKLHENLEDRAEVARITGRIGAIRVQIGARATALEPLERSLKLKEQLGDRAGFAMTLSNIGLYYGKIGEYRRALEIQERALKLFEELGDRAGVASALGNLGGFHCDLGDYAKALDFQERALKLQEELGDRQGVARTLGNIGLTHLDLGAFARALEIQERALKSKEELGDRAGAAMTLGVIGSVHLSLGDPAKALAFQERALKLSEELGDRDAIAFSLMNLGNIHSSLGAYAKAIEFHERALKLSEELGNQARVASAVVNLGHIHEARGAPAQALEHHERGEARAREVGELRTLVHALWGRARSLLALGRHVESAAAAREAALITRDLGLGTSDEQAASARSEFRDVLDVGLIASARYAHTAGASFFLESSRAGGLIESLKARDALLAAVLPPELVAEERVARGAESAATAALQRALAGGNRAQIKASREALAAAQAAIGDVIERMQRTAKAAASVVHPTADDLSTIQARLSDGEALVLYGLTEKESFALVVTPKDARIVTLGATADVESACAALNAGDPRLDPTAATVKLRKLVVEPLGIDPKTTRVLVSPDGGLSYVPFVLLMPEWELAYMPSGTMHGLLLDDTGKRGEGVLALGDPDYSVKSAPREQAVALRGGTNLVRLPATGVEAQAIGTVTLIGKDATEQGLRDALAKEPRWRAVHLACHGLVDPERPMFSSLALTPAGEDDGFLTALEVFRLKCPADLVVLSACETGKGKVYKAEGIVGLTRAFMFAGSPRVLVSLWKVDDDATRALMTKFHELWNPKVGKGVAPATALRRAQEFVKSQQKWKHPRFWAAWVLWGLPE